MDVQRGDQVYYRGEVWTVQWTSPTAVAYDKVTLGRTNDRGLFEWAETFTDKVQRVEQVR